MGTCSLEFWARHQTQCSVSCCLAQYCPKNYDCQHLKARASSESRRLAASRQNFWTFSRLCYTVDFHWPLIPPRGSYMVPMMGAAVTAPLPLRAIHSLLGDLGFSPESCEPHSSVLIFLCFLLLSPIFLSPAPQCRYTQMAPKLQTSLLPRCPATCLKPWLPIFSVPIPIASVTRLVTISALGNLRMVEHVNREPIWIGWMTLESFSWTTLATSVFQVNISMMSKPVSTILRD